MVDFVKCEACQNILSDQATFCPKCGHPVVGKAAMGAENPSRKAAPKMRASEKIALAAFILGALACLAMKVFTTFPWWPSIIVGALVAGAAYEVFLQLGANESIVDSKLINKE